MGFGSGGIAGASGSRRGVSFLNGEEIAHAKDAKGGKVYKGLFFWGRDCSRQGRKGREPYYIPRTRYFKGRPKRAGGNIGVVLKFED